MQLLAPLWLLAGLATVIPLIYHLRRNSPPEVIRVGSTADLASGVALANRRTPRNLLLLLMRCLLLLLVATALAQPWVGSTRAGRRVVVAPSGDWDLLDSLSRTGATVLPVSSSRFPWSAALAAEDRTAPGDTLMLIAPDDAARWIGPRPSLARVSIAVPAPGADTALPGPPSHQLTPALEGANGVRPRHDAAPMLWWILLTLAMTERLVARRSPDAG